MAPLEADNTKRAEEDRVPIRAVSNKMARVAVRLISTYQKTISPDHGIWRHNYPYGFCRFYPTCSEYSKQAIIRFGLLKGIWLGFFRLSRCHPWNAGGIDLVPKTR